MGDVSDAPKAQAAWDGQYARGEWDYLAGVAEISHYAVIVGYGTYLRPGGSVLDVGCGKVSCRSATCRTDTRTTWASTSRRSPWRS